MTENIDRRTVLRRGAVVTAGVLAGCTAGGESGSGGSGDGGSGDGGETDSPTGTPTESAGDETTAGSSDDSSGTAGEFGGWMDGVGNYDGVVDATGQSEVTVTVGAQANGGAFGFDPAAVRVDAGTTVVWEWTGKGAQHNVVAEEGADFESELTSKAGHTFSWTPESGTTATYYCTPHRSLGMKGVVVVE